MYPETPTLLTAIFQLTYPTLVQYRVHLFYDKVTFYISLCAKNALNRRNTERARRKRILCESSAFTLWLMTQRFCVGNSVIY